MRRKDYVKPEMKMLAGRMRKFLMNVGSEDAGEVLSKKIRPEDDEGFDDEQHWTTLW